MRSIRSMSEMVQRQAVPLVIGTMLLMVLGQVFCLATAPMPVWQSPFPWDEFAFRLIPSILLGGIYLAMLRQTRVGRTSASFGQFLTGMLTFLIGTLLEIPPRLTVPDVWNVPMSYLLQNPRVVWIPLGLILLFRSTRQAITLFQQAHYDRDRLKTILTFSETVSLMDEERALQEAVDCVRRLTGADACVLYLVDSEAEVLRAAAYYHNPAVYDEDYVQRMISFACPKGHGVTGRVFETGEAVLVRNTAADGRVQSMRDELRTARTSLVLPMKVRGRLIGVLRMTKDGVDQFSEADQAVAAIYANHAAVALEASELYHTVLRASRTDHLTGLPNARAFHEALGQAVREGQPFALLMVDADALKPVNDSLGHQAGDKLLSQLAESLCRATDGIGTAYRYAGDEFMVVLPGADRAQAVTVADRIRLTEAEGCILAPGGMIFPTVSIGVAGFPSDGTGTESMLAAADRAMYQAKQGGKNRVCLAS